MVTTSLAPACTETPLVPLTRILHGAVRLQGLASFPTPEHDQFQIPGGPRALHN